MELSNRITNDIKAYNNANMETQSAYLCFE